MSYSLEVKNVTKVMGKNLIIDDVSFKLEKGKIYGLVGANGSGKSTLLKVIMGLSKFKGEVIINGYNVKSSFKEALSEVGGIVDFVSFYDYLTAYENLRYYALIYEVDLSRVDEVLKIVNLSKDDKKVVKKFSLGMKQRLGIAIALLKDPTILILDEPTNGLDPKGIVELRELLLSFTDKTIIVSSHIISEIEKIVDEVLFINNKKIYQKKIKRDGLKKCISFKLGKNYLSNPLYEQLCKDKKVYMTNNEIAESVKNLVNSNIDVYGIKEEDSLEDILISMMNGGKDD